MIPLLTLYFIPVGLIAIVIIAVIRLIIRASQGSNTNGNYTKYNHPSGTGQQKPYNQNQQNPYNQQQNPYTQQQNPYTQKQTPADPNNPQTWQNPYQQPDYTQTNYTQPNYTQPNYQQPTYTPPTYHSPGIPPETAKRSTTIQSNYATHVGAPPQKKRNVALIVILSVVGAIAIGAAAVGYLVYQKTSGAGSLVGEGFRLAYENPTENTYYLVLDGWDTIKVEPFTNTEDLDYKHRRDLTTFHWQMLDADRKVIADTTVSQEEMQSWVYDRSLTYYGYSTVLFNPSRTQYVYYTTWEDEELGENYMDEVKIGDKTYHVDAYTTHSAFIFDGRDPEFSTDIEHSSYSTLPQNQFLLSSYDFEVFYRGNAPDNKQHNMMEDFRAQLVQLFEVARAEVLVNNAYEVDDVTTCYALDSLTPSTVGRYTTPADFIPAIDFVTAHSKLFKATGRKHYNYVVDNSETLLKHSYVETDRAPGFIKMTRISYMVHKEGLMDDQPGRSSYFEEPRNTTDGSYY